jgi:hypothetical protein
MPFIKSKILILSAVVFLLSPALFADATNFAVNSVVTNGPVKASATFVTSTGQVVITLTNLLSSASTQQLVSALQFSWSGPMGSGGGTIMGSGALTNGSATFTTLNARITSGSNIFSTVFTFGNEPGIDVDGVKVATTPELGTLALFGTGLLGLARVARRRFSLQK